MTESTVRLTNGQRWTSQDFLDHYLTPSASGSFLQKGPQMNFSLLQWVSGFVLDLLIKSTLITFIGLLVTLNGAPVVGFVFAAILLSMFHLVCLFLSSVFVDLLERFRSGLSRMAEFLLTLTSANFLFVLAFAVFPSLDLKPGETAPNIGENLIVGAVLAITNVLPMLIVAGCSRLFRRS